MQPRCSRDAQGTCGFPATSTIVARSGRSPSLSPSSSGRPVGSSACPPSSNSTRSGGACSRPAGRVSSLCVWSCAVCVSLHAWPASSVLRAPIPRSPSLAVCLSPLALSPARLAAHARDRDGRRVGRRERHRHRLSCAACPEADDRRACCEDTGVRELARQHAAGSEPEYTESVSARRCRDLHSASRRPPSASRSAMPSSAATSAAADAKLAQLERQSMPPPRET